jgi:nucleoid-associated protein Lsr2
VEVLIDDLDGSGAAETVLLGWNGDCRELDLSKRNWLRFRGRWTSGDGPARPRHNRLRRALTSRSARAKRDPILIRAWATENGIAIPARGRTPVDVERRYPEATGRS